MSLDSTSKAEPVTTNDTNEISTQVDTQNLLFHAHELPRKSRLIKSKPKFQSLKQKCISISPDSILPQISEQKSCIQIQNYKRRFKLLASKNKAQVRSQSNAYSKLVTERGRCCFNNNRIAKKEDMVKQEKIIKPKRQGGNNRKNVSVSIIPIIIIEDLNFQLKVQKPMITAKTHHMHSKSDNSMRRLTKLKEKLKKENENNELNLVITTSKFSTKKN